MPLLPLVTGYGSSPMPSRMSRAQPRDLGALREPHARSRVEVEHEPVGVAAVAVGVEAPLRHVQLEARDLREVDERRDVADERIVLGSVEWGIGIRCTQSGAPRSRSFAKNDAGILGADALRASACG